MKKIISTLLLALMSMPAIAADVSRPGAAMYVTIGTGIVWNNLTSNYILDATNPGTGVCITVINNVASQFQFNLSAFTTSNLSQVTFTGSTAWTQVPISPPASASPQYTVAAIGTLQLYIRIPGAAHYVLGFSSPTASASNTVTIFAVQTPSPCGGVNQWVAKDEPAAGAVSTAAVVPAVPGVRHVANCVSVGMVNTAAAAAQSATINIRDGGSAANCTTGTSLWTQALAVTVTAGSSAQISVCGLNIASTAGNALQFCETAAGVAGIVYRMSMNGYDQ